MSHLLTQKELANIIGSWHPRGFHGHTRSKSRTEFADIYRQSAKPIPPEKFKKRLNEESSIHSFSKHDNRQIFLNDPLLFGSGVGKRKIESRNKNRWNPEFIAWCEDSGKDRFKRTVYQKDFCENSSNLSSNSKLLTGRQTWDNRAVSVYACNYPANERLNDLAKETRRDNYFRFINKNRAKSSFGERLTVASCMVWNDKVKNEPKSDE